MTHAPLSTELYETVADTTSDGGLDANARGKEAGNFLRHAASLAMTKTADGLIDPKLVLSWLLTHLGAGAFLIGLLVPVREAGSLLPQLFTAARIHALRRRKWAWAAGSAVQGVAALGIGFAAFRLEGTAAGLVVLGWLAVLALARSVCSVAHKDVLGKTVGKTRRGTATGIASSVASAGILAFAVILMTGIAPREIVVTAALVLAGVLWMGAAASFATLREAASEEERRYRSVFAAFSSLRDPQLRRFIATRGLLTASALAPPYIVILAGQEDEGALGHLGALVFASAAASLVSGYVWGRLSDRSSRMVLVLSGVAAAVALAAALLLDRTGTMQTVWTAPVVLFLLMLSYNGVRQGRSTHLVDMAQDGSRADYTAVSNTVIGIVLLGSGLFGALASTSGPEWTLTLFAAMCLAGAALALSLDDVQQG